MRRLIEETESRERRECLAINKNLLIKSGTCIRHISSSSPPRSTLRSFATQFQLSGSRGILIFFCFLFSIFFYAPRVSNSIVRLRKINGKKPKALRGARGSFKTETFVKDRNKRAPDEPLLHRRPFSPLSRRLMEK